MNRSRRQCRACRADIVFAGTVNGRPMPVDALPQPGGNVRLRDDDGFARAEVLGPLEQQLADDEGEPLHYSHFATCPDADEFRGGHR